MLVGGWFRSHAATFVLSDRAFRGLGARLGKAAPGDVFDLLLCEQGRATSRPPSARAALAARRLSVAFSPASGGSRALRDLAVLAGRL